MRLSLHFLLVLIFVLSGVCVSYPAFAKKKGRLFSPSSSNVSGTAGVRGWGAGKPSKKKPKDAESKPPQEERPDDDRQGQKSKRQP